MIVIMKNRVEKGRRVLVIGLKPHSKGDIFSNLIIFFFEKIIASFIVIKVIIEIIIIEIVNK